MDKEQEMRLMIKSFELDQQLFRESVDLFNQALTPFYFILAFAIVTVIGGILTIILGG